MEYIPQIKYLTCAHCQRLLFIILTVVVNEENIGWFCTLTRTDEENILIHLGDVPLIILKYF